MRPFCLHAGSLPRYAQADKQMGNGICRDLSDHRTKFFMIILKYPGYFVELLTGRQPWHLRIIYTTNLSSKQTGW